MAPQTEQKIYVGIGLDFETGGLDCRECACTQIALQDVYKRQPYGTTHCRWDAVIDIPGMWNAVQGISRPDTPVPVSYTHLDVYKRQVLSFIVLDIHPDFPGVSHGLYGLVLSEKMCIRDR